MFRRAHLGKNGRELVECCDLGVRFEPLAGRFEVGVPAAAEPHRRHPEGVRQAEIDARVVADVDRRPRSGRQLGEGVFEHPRIGFRSVELGGDNDRLEAIGEAEPLQLGVAAAAVRDHPEPVLLAECVEHSLGVGVGFQRRRAAVERLDRVVDNPAREVVAVDELVEGALRDAVSEVDLQQLIVVPLPGFGLGMVGGGREAGPRVAGIRVQRVVEIEPNGVDRVAPRASTCRLRSAVEPKW